MYFLGTSSALAPRSHTDPIPNINITYTNIDVNDNIRKHKSLEASLDQQPVRSAQQVKHIVYYLYS